MYKKSIARTCFTLIPIVDRAYTDIETRQFQHFLLLLNSILLRLRYFRTKSIFRSLAVTATNPLRDKSTNYLTVDTRSTTGRSMMERRWFFSTKLLSSSPFLRRNLFYFRMMLVLRSLVRTATNPLRDSKSECLTSPMRMDTSPRSVHKSQHIIYLCLFIQRTVRTLG